SRFSISWILRARRRARCSPRVLIPTSAMVSAPLFLSRISWARRVRVRSNPLASMSWDLVFTIVQEMKKPPIPMEGRRFENMPGMSDSFLLSDLAGSGLKGLKGLRGLKGLKGLSPLKALELQMYLSNIIKNLLQGNTFLIPIVYQSGRLRFSFLS